MEDNIIDTLKIEIVGDSGKAVDSIGKLISTLEKIKGATSGSNKGLNAIQKNLSKISDAVSKIDSNSTSKLRDIADGLKGLNEVGNIRTGKTADRIVDLGAAVDLLKDVDFSKLTELANGLQALGNAGNVNVPHFDNNSSPAANIDVPATLSPDLGTVNEWYSSMENIKEAVTSATDGVNGYNDATSRMDAENLIKMSSEADALRMKIESVTEKLQKLLNAPNSDKSAIADLILKAKKLEEQLGKVQVKAQQTFNETAKTIQSSTVQDAPQAHSPTIDVDAFVKSKSEVDLLNMKLDEARNKLQSLLSGGNTDNTAIADLVSKIKSLEGEIENASHKGTAFKKILGGLGTAATKTGGFFKELVKTPLNILEKQSKKQQRVSEVSLKLFRREPCTEQLTPLSAQLPRVSKRVRRMCINIAKQSEVHLLLHSIAFRQTFCI